MLKKSIFVLAVFLSIECNKKDHSVAQPSTALPFELKPFSVTVVPGQVDEVSGMVASKSFPGHLWLQQDGGNPAELILMDDKGAVKKRIPIKSAYNRDWEDMAFGKGPSADSNYIYIAETGDNSQVYPSYSIYRFTEPTLNTDTIRNFDKINFKYPDGSHDAEAIFTGKNGDIFIITKRDSVSKIYKLPFPHNTSTVTTVTAVGQLTFSGVTGAASSPSGNEILIKTYSAIYYWKLSSNENPENALQRKPLQLGYEQEAQGEALCFLSDTGGFFTLSERPFFATSVALNYYKRK
jgi:hypothetical protein